MFSLHPNTTFVQKPIGPILEVLDGSVHGTIELGQLNMDEIHKHCTIYISKMGKSIIYMFKNAQFKTTANSFRRTNSTEDGICLNLLLPLKTGGIKDIRSKQP